MAKRLVAVTAFWLVFSLPVYAILPQPKVSNWADLSPAERQALAPIAGEYDKLPDSARKRFRGAAKRYPHLNPAEQKRFQSQLTEWAKMNPEERKKAREKYREFSELPPEKRNEVKEKWREHQEKKRVQQAPAPPAQTLNPPPAQQPPK